MNWYNLLKFAQRIDYRDVVRKMPSYQTQYGDIGHDIRGQNKSFLWFMDDSFKFYYTRAEVNNPNHNTWADFINADRNGAVIAQGRYDTLNDKVSLGGWPDDYSKNPRRFEYIKNKIEETLYEEFGPTIDIVDFTT